MSFNLEQILSLFYIALDKLVRVKTLNNDEIKVPVDCLSHQTIQQIQVYIEEETNWQYSQKHRILLAKCHAQKGIIRFKFAMKPEIYNKYEPDFQAQDLETELDLAMKEMFEAIRLSG